MKKKLVGLFFTWYFLQVSREVFPSSSKLKFYVKSIQKQIYSCWQACEQKQFAEILQPVVINENRNLYLLFSATQMS